MEQELNNFLLNEHVNNTTKKNNILLEKRNKDDNDLYDDLMNTNEFNSNINPIKFIDQQKELTKKSLPKENRFVYNKILHFYLHYYCDVLTMFYILTNLKLKFNSIALALVKYSDN